jgi:hypothetical protein
VVVHFNTSSLPSTQNGEKKPNVYKLLKACALLGFLPLKFDSVGQGVTMSKKRLAIIGCFDILLATCKYNTSTNHAFYNNMLPVVLAKFCFPRKYNLIWNLFL